MLDASLRALLSEKTCPPGGWSQAAVILDMSRSSGLVRDGDCYEDVVTGYVLLLSSLRLDAPRRCYCDSCHWHYTILPIAMMITSIVSIPSAVAITTCIVIALMQFYSVSVTTGHTYCTSFRGQSLGQFQRRLFEAGA